MDAIHLLLTAGPLSILISTLIQYSGSASGQGRKYEETSACDMILQFQGFDNGSAKDSPSRDRIDRVHLRCTK